MVLNVSQLLDYQRCPVYWHHKYVSKRGPEPGDALAHGTYFHKCAEQYLKNEPLIPPSFDPVTDRMRETFESGAFPKLPVVATEIVLEMPLGHHTLIGTLDNILPAEEAGHFLSGQYKTCQGGQDMERQCNAVQYSYHESAYEALMNHNGYPCAGTHLVIYKKLTKGELATGANPLSFHILERPPGYVAKILTELEEWADRMEAAGPTPTPHRRSCIQGNIRCAYWDVCYNGLPLSDARFIQLEGRY